METAIDRNTLDDIGSHVRWDLSVFYGGLDDPRIESDLMEFERLAKDFNSKYKGHLVTSLGDALGDYSELDMLSNKIAGFLFLLQSLDVADPKVKTKVALVDSKLSQVQGEYLAFFDIELVDIDDTALNNLYENDAVVAKHRPWLDHIRVFKPHLLSEPVESALIKRSPFGPSAWSEFFDECEADLRFEFGGSEKSLAEMLDILSNSKDISERALVMKMINEGLGGAFAKYSAQTLYMVVGKDAVERKERGYRHPMDGRNKSNRIPDSVVDALHEAVMSRAAPLARRYYRLKAKLLGLEVLAWSDSNSPLPFDDSEKVPFEDALQMVLKAYGNFSPTLAGIISGEFVSGRCIDAPGVKGKRGGAYNYSLVLPGGKCASFTFLNYLGSNRDVMTLAHELGHGVHGILAGRAQGPLMFHAPTAYCETASVFGEMTTFNYLKKQLEAKGEKAATLSLISKKIEDIIKSVVRQIGFSNFEKRLHGMDESYKVWGEVKKLSAGELDSIWLKTLEDIYGPSGEVFTYENAEHLWSYISHFHRPFYVYGYAFGELLTQSLYAEQARLGDDFEKLYIDMLSSGSTKDVVELLKPFGLDPTVSSFWERGIDISLGAMVEEAERLAASM